MEFTVSEVVQLLVTFKTYSSIDIRRRIAVWLIQKRDHADQNGFHTMHGQPTFAGLFVAEIIVARLVQNRNANIAVLIDWVGWFETEDPRLGN